jgi:hypothetical protein
MKKEVEWREVVGWPEYEVSEYGDVYSVRRLQILKPQINPSGRPTVRLSRKYRGPETKIVSHLVVEAFIGPPDTDVAQHRVRHIDGDFLNNHYTNLEWEN